jgi:hypothetical protein
MIQAKGMAGNKDLFASDVSLFHDKLRFKEKRN